MSASAPRPARRRRAAITSIRRRLAAGAGGEAGARFPSAATRAAAAAELLARQDPIAACAAVHAARGRWRGVEPRSASAARLRRLSAPSRCRGGSAPRRSGGRRASRRASAPRARRSRRKPPNCALPSPPISASDRAALGRRLPATRDVLLLVPGHPRRHVVIELWACMGLRSTANARRSAPRPDVPRALERRARARVAAARPSVDCLPGTPRRCCAGGTPDARSSPARPTGPLLWSDGTCAHHPAHSGASARWRCSGGRARQGSTSAPRSLWTALRAHIEVGKWRARVGRCPSVRPQIRPLACASGFTTPGRRTPEEPPRGGAVAVTPAHRGAMTSSSRWARRRQPALPGHTNVSAVAAMPTASASSAAAAISTRPSACGASTAPSRTPSGCTSTRWRTSWRCLTTSTHSRFGRPHRQALQRRQRRRPAHPHALQPLRDFGAAADGLRFVSGSWGKTACIVYHEAQFRPCAHPGGLQEAYLASQAEELETRLEEVPAARAWRRQRHEGGGPAARGQAGGRPAPPLSSKRPPASRQASRHDPPGKGSLTFQKR